MQRRSIIALVLATAVAGSAVGAQTGSGPLHVAELTLVGVHAVDETLVRRVMQTREPSWFAAWVPWIHRPVFDAEVFQTDLRRIVGFYADRGYPDARVVAHDVDLDRERSLVTITVRIEEGAPRILSAVELEGFDSMTPAALSALRAELPVHVGAPAVHEEIITAAQMTANALEEEGYPYAKVEVIQNPTGDDRVAVRYVAESGRRATFGPIEITGNVSVADQVILRELTYRPGELFRRSTVQESQRQLFGLDLFDFASIDWSRVPPADVVATRITVAEASPQDVRFSFGYGTEEKARGEIRWRHLNVGGGARTFTAHGKYSALDRGAELSFTQPYFLTNRLAFSVDGNYWFTDEAAFDVRTRGVRASVRGDLGANSSWTAELSWQNERSQIDPTALGDPELRNELIALGLDPTTGRQRGVLTQLALTGERATWDDPLDPQRGTFVSLRLAQAGAWLPGTYAFIDVLADGRYYAPVRGTVIASRVQFGSIDPIGADARVPFFRRYFLGGSTSLRGWGRFEVSPLSRSGLPIGGLGLFQATVEGRHPLAVNIDGVAFLDAGRVGARPWQVEFSDLQYDVGGGLRYTSPVGPLRLDVAYQLTPISGLVIEAEPERRRWRLHFSIGEAF